MVEARNQVKIKIYFKNEFFTCSVNKDVSGATLLSFACKRIGTFEPWWFGLEYLDSRKITCWVAFDKKIGSHDITKEGEWLRMCLKLKHFPENIQAEVIQTKTIQIFYDQVHGQVMNEKIYSDPGVIVLLAGTHLQYQYGDLSGTSDGKKILEEQFLNLVPSGLKERHNMSKADWLGMIEDFWRNSSELSKHEALKESMNTIQSLDMYGVDYFDIKNKKKTSLLLGITSQGMNIYKLDNKLVPKVCLSWHEIRSISYYDKKFTIKPLDKTASEFIMYSTHNKENINIMDLCIERHEMFLARRKPDTNDVVAWKVKAKEAEKVVDNEIKEHKQNIQKKKEYTTTLKQIQEATVAKLDDEELQKRLKKAYEEALKDMNSKVDALESDKERLNRDKLKAEKELEDSLRDKVNMKEEKERKHKDALAEEHAKSILLAQQMEEESKRLQRELDAFKKKYDEDQVKLKQLQRDVDDGKKIELEKSVDEYTKERAENMKTRVDKFTHTIRARRTKTTENDSNNDDSVSSGADKFKTLRMLRSGNVRTRIDEFEGL